MTKPTTSKRRDILMVSGSEPYQPANKFMLEIRDVPFLDSRQNHIIVSDIDGVVKNFATDRYLILEDKCRLAMPTRPAEESIIGSLARGLSKDPYFVGFYCLQHENTCTGDGYSTLRVYRTGSNVLNGDWEYIQIQCPLDFKERTCSDLFNKNSKG